MSTPYNAPYKVEQREAKASKRRVYPIWISCHVLYDGLSLTKITAQGTRRRRAKQNRPRGKAAVKAAKRSTHNKRHYWQERWEAAVMRESNRMNENFSEALTYLYAVSPKAAAITRLGAGIAQ